MRKSSISLTMLHEGIRRGGGGGGGIQMNPSPLGLISYSKWLGRPRANLFGVMGRGHFPSPVSPRPRHRKKKKTRAGRVKSHSPKTTYFVKKQKNPHPGAGELCQIFLPRGNAIHSRHPPRPNLTKKKCTSPSYKEKLRKTEIILPINSTKSNSHARTRS